ncbi:MAG: NifB/NifX family molybdenum-iron cluster-binding protein [Deltaproteobacteria bacterium]|jgi:predicted Fe-Mo cluster-binding NifX family protein|nr:NifB/NifX family molybdenum-iron cluster-binding protein [Deltaproteobacteria bacterium]
MKLAVSANGGDLDSQLDARFGRCAFFLVINPDDLSFEVFENAAAGQGGGAGIQAAQFLAAIEVDAVITGNCGPNAVQTLSAAGVDVFPAQMGGTVREVVERFKKGKLKPASTATVQSHFGMVADGESRIGGGPGRGMGGGSRQGRVMNMLDPEVSQRRDADIRSWDQEMENLKQQASRLNDRMKEVISRINRLERHEKQ